MNEAQEEALKVRFRAFTRRLGAGIGLAGLLAAFLLCAVQATFRSGFRPVYLWGPVGAALALGLAFFLRRRFVLAGLCAAFIGVHLRALPKAAAAADAARQRRVAAPRLP